MAPIVAIDVGQQPQRRPGGASGSLCAGRSADRARRVGARLTRARGFSTSKANGGSKGAEFLRSYKLKETSVTNRVVAACCNSAVFMNFDRGPHWVSAYRARFRGELPPLQLRICTKFKPNGVVLPDDVPSYRGYAPRLIVKLLASRVAMLLGR